MTTATTAATEMIDGLLDTYLLALAGVDQCPDSAPAEVKARLQANVERAERAFSDAAADGLVRDCSHLVPLVQRLFAANRLGRQSLRDAEPIGRLAGELERATCLAVEIAGELEVPFQTSESTL
jgi:hypothetical protein